VLTQQRQWQPHQGDQFGGGDRCLAVFIHHVGLHKMIEQRLQAQRLQQKGGGGGCGAGQGSGSDGGRQGGGAGGGGSGAGRGWGIGAASAPTALCITPSNARADAGGAKRFRGSWRGQLHMRRATRLACWRPAAGPYLARH
jgi:hypothetical protein